MARKKSLKQNFSIKVQQVKTLFNIWCRKDFVVFGKAIIIKAL